MITKTNRITIIAMIFITLLPVATEAEVALPKIFGDGMVLQREKAVRVWGWADAGEKVTVRFGGQAKSAVAGDEGDWSVTLDAMEASFEDRELVVETKANKVTIADVLVGEVWLCGGQSNMEWSMRSCRDADVEMLSADYPAMRFIRLPHIAKLKPQKDFPVKNPQSPEGNWRVCTSKQVENCTAVGYYFARRLHRRLKVPVGIIDTSWGGTMAQHWCTKETLRGFDEVKPYFEKFEQTLTEWIEGGREDGAKKRYENDVKAWEKKRDQARRKGEREPRKPNPNSYTNPGDKHQPGGMFNGMIAPLAPMTIRGVLFYQGENNSFTTGWKPFPQTFPAVIADWRKTFAEPDLPFGIIQIAGWSTRRTMTYDMNHHTNIIREIQFDTWQTTPNTGLIVTFDTNSNGSIHPSRKLPVGERSARWALAEVYKAKPYRSGNPLEWRGPVYRSMEIENDKITITFEEGTNRGLRLDKDQQAGFYIAAENKEFHIASARIVKDNKVQIWCEDVSNPTAARYGWSNLPIGSLMNARELPAYPFRTDTWPLTPHQSTGEYQIQKK